MNVFLFSVSFVAIFSTINVQAASFSSTQVESHFRVDEEDCSKFYIRRNGEEIQIKCPDDHVVNKFSRSCVPKGSSPDTCVDGINKSNDNGKCTKKSEKFVNEESCAKYYDCADATSTTDQPKAKECPFRQLFDEKSQTCQHFSMVDCGTRYEPKDACEYEENQCRTSHCIPCYVRFPSCKGSSEGLNPLAGREWTPYFIVCKNERLVFQGQCPLLSDGKPAVFNPVNHVCVEMEILH